MALNNNDLFLVNQGGVSKKITYENLKTNLVADKALWELDGTDIKPVDDNNSLVVNQDIQSTSQNGGPLAGFRNQIINGDFQVNQRSGNRTPGVGVYGFDRWKGHASGLEQVVEALPAGEYTLSWVGGGNGTFGGTTNVSPITATVAAGNTSVVVPSDATNVQLEPGPVATPFERRPIGIELALCQRYFVRRPNNAFIYSSNATVNQAYSLSTMLPVTMRDTPQVPAATLTSAGSQGFGPINVISTTPESIIFQSICSFDLAAAYYFVGYDADAEF
jgi:hypothetical protein